MRVLGIDPGTATTGWAVIEEKGGVLSPVAYGHISTEKNIEESKRILEINDCLAEIIEKYEPKEAAVEKIFFFKNEKTVIQVGQSRGSMLLTLEQKNVTVYGYTPLQVKQAITGYGKAEKKQVQLMTKTILKLKEMPKPDDTADAIAIAICHINSRRINNLIL
ncbi:MAG TPA: crossover junction endodeoxyribonuclease RuvC [Candidatus Moranbacteria bacterium]|nr:crossover junction endodeoxyribonuclease RuvC [Candidatus Moranbacteria bacterium]